MKDFLIPTQKKAVRLFQKYSKNYLSTLSTFKTEEDGGQDTRFARRSDTGATEGKRVPVQPIRRRNKNGGDRAH